MPEPISLTEAKDWLRVDHSAEDELIERLISAARGWAEKYCGRVFVSGEHTQTFDAWPAAGEGLRLRWPPVASIDTVTYVDADGVTQTLDADVYELDEDTWSVRLAYDQSWPTVRDHADVIAVTYTADPGTLPEYAKTGMLLLLAHLYTHRMTVSPDAGEAMPWGADVLLDACRDGRIA